MNDGSFLYMNGPIKKISLILFFIILLPILFFTVREIVSLSENENILGQIYRNQLESILFSVNQYSEDVVRNWSFDIQAAFEINKKSEKNLKSWLEDFYQRNGSMISIFIADSNFTDISSYAFKKTKIVKEDVSKAVSVFKENKNLIQLLFRYQAKGFNKITPINSNQEKTNQFLIFVLNNGKICGFEIAPKMFVEQNLASKIQSVAHEDFIVSVFDSTSSKTIFSSASSQGNFEQSKRLWLFPNYSLGIKLTGETIEGLVKNRTQTNLILIACLTILMLFAAWFGYRNIKKEVALAQIKSDFVSNVSHELRTPLALINMFAETLALGRVKNEDKRDEYYNIIQQETERLSKIVNKILSFSKIEAGKWTYHFVNTDLKCVVDKIYDNYKFHLSSKGFEFTCEQNKEPLNLNVDPEAVSEAVINLIDNAVKYSVDNKKIILRTGRSINKIFIEVEDRGIGISKGDQKKIFDKFFRVTSGNVHNVKGTGLGLALVKHIVDAHKGSIELNSELGRGSTFRLSFPVF